MKKKTRRKRDASDSKKIKNGKRLGKKRGGGRKKISMKEGWTSWASLAPSEAARSNLCCTWMTLWDSRWERRRIREKEVFVDPLQLLPWLFLKHSSISSVKDASTTSFLWTLLALDVSSGRGSRHFRRANNWKKKKKQRRKKDKEI